MQIKPARRRQALGTPSTAGVQHVADPQLGHAKGAAGKQTGKQAGKRKAEIALPEQVGAGKVRSRHYHCQHQHTCRPHRRNLPAPFLPSVFSLRLPHAPSSSSSDLPNV